MLKYDMYISGKFSASDVYNINGGDRLLLMSVFVHTISDKLKSLGYRFELAVDDLNVPRIDITTVEKVDMDTIIEAFEQFEIIDIYLEKDGYYYLILNEGNEEEQLFKLFEMLFAKYGLTIIYEPVILSLEFEGEDDAVDTRAFKLVEIKEKNCLQMIGVGEVEFKKILESLGGFTQREDLISWDSEDYSDVLNNTAIKRLLGGVSNNKNFEEEILPTLNSVVRKEVISSLDRMSNNKRNFLLAHDVSMREPSNFLILSLEPFNNLIEVLFSLFGERSKGNATEDYFKAMNNYVVSVILEAKKRSNSNGRKFIRASDL